MAEKRGIKIENRQAQDLSLTKFMPIATASCAQACRQDIFCRLSHFLGPALAIFLSDNALIEVRFTTCSGLMLVPD